MEGYICGIFYDPLTKKYTFKDIEGEHPKFISEALGNLCTNAKKAAEQAKKRIVLEVKVQYESIE